MPYCPLAMNEDYASDIKSILDEVEGAGDFAVAGTLSSHHKLPVIQVHVVTGLHLTFALSDASLRCFVLSTPL